MQTLNVGAGRTDQEYKAAEDQRRADLLAESRNAANYFFWAAGAAALASGLFPLRIHFLVNIGAFDLLGLYGRRFLAAYPLAGDGVVGAWLLALVGLGFAVRAGHRWAFWVGNRSVCSGHVCSHGYIFIVGIRGPCFLRVQMVRGTEGTERA